MRYAGGMYEHINLMNATHFAIQYRYWMSWNSWASFHSCSHSSYFGFLLQSAYLIFNRIIFGNSAVHVIGSKQPMISMRDSSFRCEYLVWLKFTQNLILIIISFFWRENCWKRFDWSFLPTTVSLPSNILQITLRQRFKA